MKNHPLMLLPFLASLTLGATGCTQNKPGAPTPESSSAKNAEETVWTCSMHPEVRSNKPGLCPICHMKLVPLKSLSPRSESSPQAMHSEHSEHSDHSGHDGARDQMSAGAPAAAVGGRASLQLTPEQEILSGVKPVAAVHKVLKHEIEAPGRVTSAGRVSFQIFEQDLGLLKAGQSFVASSPSLPGETLRGKLLSVSSILDPMTRTGRVEGTFDGAHGSRLRGEATVTGVIQVETARVIAIPENAVMHTGSADLVFITDGKGAYRPAAVRLGIKAQGFYEVVEGLQVGTLVSSGPNFLLDSEARVRAGGASAHEHGATHTAKEGLKP